MQPAFSTRAVHAGRHDFVELGVHAPPLDFSSTYPTPDLDAAARSFDALVAGDAPEGSFVYQRLFNPTTDRCERCGSPLSSSSSRRSCIDRRSSRFASEGAVASTDWMSTRPTT